MGYLYEVDTESTTSSTSRVPLMMGTKNLPAEIKRKNKQNRLIISFVICLYPGWGPRRSRPHTFLHIETDSNSSGAQVLQKNQIDLLTCSL